MISLANSSQTPSVVFKNISFQIRFPYGKPMHSKICWPIPSPLLPFSSLLTHSHISHVPLPFQALSTKASPFYKKLYSESVASTHTHPTLTNMYRSQKLKLKHLYSYFQIRSTRKLALKHSNYRGWVLLKSLELSLAPFSVALCYLVCFQFGTSLNHMKNTMFSSETASIRLVHGMSVGYFLDC